MADKVSDRRMLANGFFLTLNTTLGTILAFTYGKLAQDKRAVLILISLIGLAVAMTWFFAIRSYKKLNKAKFTVINQMETGLSFQYFTKEWELLKRQTAADLQLKPLRQHWVRFKDGYTELTNIEGTVPALFAVYYLLVLVGAMLKVIIK